MQPNQPQNNNPYYFLNDKPASSGSPINKLVPRGGSLKSRIIVVVVGITVLLTLFIVFNAILSGSKNANSQNLINVVEDQSILNTIAVSGTKNSTNQAILNLAGTTTVSVSSAQSQLIGVLKTSGKTVTILNASYQNPTVNKSLADAVINGGFDSSFITNYQQTLNNYQQNIHKAFPAANTGEKKILDNIYKQNVLLLKASNSLLAS
ncbi:MAG: hypothetical protein WCI60_02985 [bacterium]